MRKRTTLLAAILFALAGALLLGAELQCGEAPGRRKH